MVAAMVLLPVAAPLAPRNAVAQEDCQEFAETGRSVCGRFLAYWKEHGGLAQQGYPINQPLREKSEIDGKVYMVQYFERAVFELHPENQPPYDVLLSLLGNSYYRQKHPGDAPEQQPNYSPGSLFFPETSKRLGGRFLEYWQTNGGLAQQGNPISDEFEERSELDGKTYTVQYFERAVFELHPGNRPPYDVLLSHLGTFQLNRRLATCIGHLKLRGKPVARGVNEQPAGMYQLRGYQVEMITLPRQITCSVEVAVNNRIREESRTFDRFWRISVAGDRINDLQGLIWHVWLDNMIVGGTGVGVKGTGAGYELAVPVYDRDLLREGATVGVSYGRVPPEETISEKLHFTTTP
jgi:hypothetical protein